ncbi:hypothetical protein MNBD_ALPHA09-164 [hydrothermal vent metagenome]|uniref:Uncharacterized protein n=1 Tax=hydrothermal vent metagenome TaxID=652676 RepID=A0A3B0TTS0_9ZZZZ
MKSFLGIGFIIVAGLVLSGCVARDLETADVQFAAYNLVEPTTNTVTVCHGYNCRYKTQINLSEDDFKGINEIFAKAPPTAAGERTAMADAIGYLERIAGDIVGTANNPGGILGNEYIGDPTRQDCIDEASTATGYLVMLVKRGLVTRHQVAKPQMRGIFIDGRWQHAAAVVTETGSGEAFVLDSWFRPNGQPAVIMTLYDWLNDFEGVEAKQLPKTG